jgi:uncharacterized protein
LKRKTKIEYKSKSKFKGKVVLITGASSGIGRQTAIDFAENDAQTIILISRSKPKLEELEKILKTKFTSEIVVYPCDISKKAEVVEMGKKVFEKFGHVDILVNNAGFGLYSKIQHQSIEEIESIIFTNYLGMVYCTKLFLNSMISERSGHIVNVASVAASFGIPGLAAYCASKYAMLGFSESLYHELHGTGVGISVVSPIGVKTNFFNNKSFRDGDQIPSYTRYMLEPKTVSNAILTAARSPRLEIIVPFYVRIGVWFKHTVPYIINPIIGALFRRELNK